MEKGEQTPDKHRNQGLLQAMSEKRKIQEDDAAATSGSVSKTAGSSSTSEKKIEHDNGKPNLSDDWADPIPVGASHVTPGEPTAAKASTKQEEGDKKPKAPFKCPYCPAVLTRSNDLRKHVEKKHQGRQDMLCHFCDFRCVDIGTYISHEIDHLCKCPYCDSYVKNYQGLPRHKQFCRENPDNQGAREPRRASTKRKSKDAVKKN